MAVEKNEEVKKTIEVLDELSQDEKEREIYESRQRELMRYNSELKYAKEEGIKEGKIEIAKRLIKKGIDKKDIAEITGLTLETIEKI